MNRVSGENNVNLAVRLYVCVCVWGGVWVCLVGRGVCVGWVGGGGGMVRGKKI